MTAEPTTPVTGPAPAPPPHGPGAGAAPAHRRILAHAALEARTVLRNGEQLVLTLVLPTILLVFLSRTDLVDLDTSDRIDLVAPGVLALAVMSTAFTSQAIATGFDRRNGVLRLLATTPLGRSGLLAGKALAVAALEAVQIVVLAGVALALGWRPDGSGIPAALAALVLGTLAFVALALLLAGTLRAEAVIAVANLVWVLLLAGGAVVLPASVLPGPLAAVAPWLPSGALGDALRAAFQHGALDLPALGVLAAWAAVLGVLTSRTFRWS